MINDYLTGERTQPAHQRIPYMKVSPEMLLFLAGKMGLIQTTNCNDEIAWTTGLGSGCFAFAPHLDKSQFSDVVLWATIQGLEPDLSPGVVRVWPIGKDYPCTEENDNTEASIRESFVVAVCLALGWEAV